MERTYKSLKQETFIIEILYKGNSRQDANGYRHPKLKLFNGWIAMDYKHHLLNWKNDDHTIDPEKVRYVESLGIENKYPTVEQGDLIVVLSEKFLIPDRDTSKGDPWVWTDVLHIDKETLKVIKKFHAAHKMTAYELFDMCAFLQNRSAQPKEEKLPAILEDDEFEYTITCNIKVTKKPISQ